MKIRCVWEHNNNILYGDDFIKPLYPILLSAVTKNQKKFSFSLDKS